MIKWWLTCYPDSYFDLAIVDPPYGIGQNWKKDKLSKFYNHHNNFNNSIPTDEYFNELFRVSKHQIIWGCNYFWNYLPPTNNLIFWDKHNDTKKQFGSAGELAWTSIKKYPLLKYDFIWSGFATCEPVFKIHPHQKPVALYAQCLSDFATPGMKILDTHLGCGSIACAVHRANIIDKMNLTLTACEHDEEYYNDAILRIKNELQTQSLF